MRKTIIILSVIAITGVVAAANNRTANEMRSIAQATINEQYRLNASSRDYSIVRETPGFCILSSDSGGTVIVAKSDEAGPVLGYSNKAYDPDDLPCGFKWWLEAMEASLASANRDAKSATIKSVPSNLPSSVAPLVKCAWGQGSPYNSQCPNGALVGCVAVAMGQVMYSHKYPDHGNGSKTYTTGGITLSVDFGNATYDWSNMWQQDEIAKLLFHCGVSVNMSYGSGSSTAYAFDVAPALSNYFRYKPDAKYVMRSNFTSTQWINLLFGNLAAGHAVVYRGTQESGMGSSGHAFVVDGYDQDGNVHVNWGWKGSLDGFYDLSTLTTMFGDSYQYNQAMVCDIIPDTQVGPTPDDFLLSLDLGGGGVVKEKVAAGKTFEFSLVPDEGLMIDYVMFNDNDVTSQLDENNTFVTPSINGNSTLMVRTKNETASDDDYVDLGLPSGLLWATTNVGANRPEEIGSFFAWAETTPKAEYSWGTYKYANGSETSLTKYCNSYSYGTVDYKETLDSEDDAATVNLGPLWRTPTLAETQELVNFCSWTPSSLNGVDGVLVTGPSGASIFFPATGVKQYGYTFFTSEICAQSATIFNASNGKPSSASVLYYDTYPHYWYGWSRCWGYTVRPVYTKTNAIGVVNADECDEIEGIYDLQGHKLRDFVNGINIVRYKNGTSKKILR